MAASVAHAVPNRLRGRPQSQHFSSCSSPSLHSTRPLQSIPCGRAADSRAGSHARRATTCRRLFRRFCSDVVVVVVVVVVVHRLLVCSSAVQPTALPRAAPSRYAFVSVPGLPMTCRKRLKPSQLTRAVRSSHFANDAMQERLPSPTTVETASRPRWPAVSSSEPHQTRGMMRAARSEMLDCTSAFQLSCRLHHGA
jgi:hypothetical protein